MVTAFMGLTSWRVVTVSHKLSIRTEARPIIFQRARWWSYPRSVDALADGTDVAARHKRLNSTSDRSAETHPPRSRLGECDDLDTNRLAGLVELDDKQFLPAFGVARAGSVREALAIGFVYDIDDPNGDSYRTESEGRILTRHGGRGCRPYGQSGSAVHSPIRDGSSGNLEILPSGSDRRALVNVVIAGGENAGRCAHLEVRQPARAGRHHGSRRWLRMLTTWPSGSAAKNLRTPHGSSVTG